ncbi:CRAL-TRIO domain-containing protein [Thamnocephalis sphaerospora]|uniref:CRAL-TRIO domain-containing protein n=1 Tax=Thamnocephalis sphaerospora TaxID=78915 RepID=A0A4P9XY68_9FUNG|nr:CRAL-TRIO domain-containing protein [Thamnocephalis sphaerospora]|eukprot:RKP10641.1 CRAL-TRIO domain-containing protein [Thamnocephalis sphaerospora]
MWYPPIVILATKSNNWHWQIMSAFRRLSIVRNAQKQGDSVRRQRGYSSPAAPTTPRTSSPVEQDALGASASSVSLFDRDDQKRSEYEPVFTLPEWLYPAPQNNEMTTEQQLRLDRVRQKLPSLIAPPGSPLHEEDVIFCTDCCLARYLRASQWDTDVATERLAKTLVWRHEHRPHLLSPAYVESEAVTGKIIVDGFDLKGGPVIYITPRLENTKSSQRQIDHMIFFLERAVAVMPPGVEKLTLIVDFAGSSVFNSPAPWVAKSVVSILDQHYPERLNAAVLVGTPWYFNQLYKLVSPLIDPITKQKIHVVDLGRRKRRTNTSSGPSGSGEGGQTSSKGRRHVSMPGLRRLTDMHGDEDEHDNDADDAMGMEIESSIWGLVPPELLHTSVGGRRPFKHNHSVYWPRLLEQTVHYRSASPENI